MIERKDLYILLAVLAASLTLQLGVFMAVHSSNPESAMAGDAPDYDHSARNLAETGLAALGPHSQDTRLLLRPPGYPFFIAASYVLFGEKTPPVIFLQVFLSIGTLLLVYGIARSLWNPAAALVSVALLALDPNSFIYAQLLNTETLVTFLLTLSAAAGVALLLDEKPKLSEALLLGAALATATMVRPISYYLAFPVLLGFWLYWKYKRLEPRKILFPLLLIALPWLVLVGGWQYRNYASTGSA
jgi:4-amino-4-deoxy-L-arabinose transferase-like glycosyltransferase